MLTPSSNKLTMAYGVVLNGSCLKKWFGIVQTAVDVAVGIADAGIYLMGQKATATVMRSAGAVLCSGL